MKRLAIVTIVARLILAAAYVLVASLVIYQVVERGYRPVPTATHALAAGHELAQGDLETKEIKSLVGHYLRQAVKAGDPISRDMISPKQLPPKIAPTIAAVVTMQPQLLWRRKIVEGSMVEVQLATPSVKLPGKVAKLICDELSCSVIVSLTKAPPSLISPDDFSAADVQLAAPAPTPSNKP